MLRSPLIQSLTFLLMASLSPGGTLYSTDFEGFTAGDNHWAGTEGWLSNNLNDGVQGILQDPVENLPLGRAAFLGFGEPADAFTVVYRPIDHDPVATGHSRIEFESLLGVQDSTNGRRDRFHLTCYNIDDDFLAAITFDNTSGQVLSDDGGTVRDTGIPFQKSDPLLGLAALELLKVTIDLDLNRWSASLNEIPLFDQIFTVTGKSLTLGTIAVEWEIPSGSPEMAGNNWLLVADWLVASIPPGRFSLLSIDRDPSGAATLVWPGHPGFDYQVQDSTDLKTWHKELPGSAVSGPSSEGPMSFTDPSAANRTRGFYRIVRSPTP